MTQLDTNDVVPGGQLPDGRHSSNPVGNSVCGIIALVLGVLAFILSFIPIVNNFAAIIAVIGVILAVVGLIGVFRGKKKGKALTIIATILNVLAIVITLGMQSGLSKSLNDSTSKSASSSVSAPKDSGSSKDAKKGDGSKSAAKGGAQDTEGDLGHAHVKIVSAARSGNDYNGAPTALVTYQWTNKDTKNTAFSVATHAQAFQNGQALDLAIYTDAPAGYDANSSLAELQPGANGTVTQGYVLKDSSPITVEITDFISTNGAKVSHTYNL
ncbi:DUF5067 domain-containing protein [Bifidobacterium bombi]|uniref:Integral membrane protein, putative tetraspanin family n=1 Tax=Bifidobacterium bombi DSM 19703 TaxID=1341695 RepID=A0A080N4N9_9BIFI|nr:DUF5067 domain-containing protein [Bifidobacterium bombi]KFF31575.1 integral membrane protein, putative tetraspanin family [Bifidobacterium bombi DSM 19703]